MEFKKVSDFVVKYAPLLGSAISISNPMAGMAIGLIAQMFGADVKNPDDILAKMSNDPNVEVKLKQIEADQKEAIIQSQTAEFQAAVSDRESARDREEKIIQLTGNRDWIIDLIAVIVIVSFFTLCALNYFVDLKDDHVMVMLIGQVSSGFMLCLSYYFGSSSK